MIGGVIFWIEGSPPGKDDLRSGFVLPAVLKSDSSLTRRSNSSGPRADTAPGLSKLAFTAIFRPECSAISMPNYKSMASLLEAASSLNGVFSLLFGLPTFPLEVEPSRPEVTVIPKTFLYKP
jgi:hypothetical protein